MYLGKTGKSYHVPSAHSSFYNSTLFTSLYPGGNQIIQMIMITKSLTHIVHLLFDNNVDGNSVVIGLESKICHLHLASAMLTSAMS